MKLKILLLLPIVIGTIVILTVLINAGVSHDTAMKLSAGFSIISFVIAYVLYQQDHKKPGRNRTKETEAR